MERQYAILELKLQPIERMIAASREQQAKLSKEFEVLAEKLLRELDKGRDLQQKLDILGDYNMDELTKDLERARKSEKDLEANLKILIENPWFTVNQSQANVTQNLRVDKSNQDAEAQIVNYRIKLQSTKGLSNELEEQHKKLEEIKERLLNEKLVNEEDLVKYVTMIAEQEKNLPPSHAKKGAQPMPLMQDDDIHHDPNTKLIFLGDEMKAKSKFELLAMGLIDVQGEKGPGWYKVKLLERDNISSTNMNNQQLAKEIERLILENGDLASHLEKANDMLNIYREMESDKRKAEELDLKILDAKIKDETAKISDLRMLLNQRMEGGTDLANLQEIEYDAKDDMFSVSEMGQDDISTNYFDLVVNYLELDRYQLEEIYRRKQVDVSQHAPKTLIAVEFYHFDTVVSPLYQETKFDPNFQATFAVSVDKNFMSFCMHQPIRIEVFSIVGTEKVRLGESNFLLADLMTQNAACLRHSRTLSAIIKKRQEVSNNLLGRPVGQISACYRMRKPCGVAAKLYMEELAGDKVLNEINGLKKVIVKIPYVRGLTKPTQTFVSYSMPDGVTYYTNTILDKNPVFNYSSAHEIQFTEELKNRLANEPIEIAVFDESMPPNNDDNTDIIGFGTLSLAPLLVGKPINELVHLVNTSTRTSCHVQIEVFIYGGMDDHDYYDQFQASAMNDSMMNPEHRQMMMTSMHFAKPQHAEQRHLARDLADYLKSKTMSLDAAFHTLDASKLS